MSGKVYIKFSELPSFWNAKYEIRSYEFLPDYRSTTGVNVGTPFSHHFFFGLQYEGDKRQVEILLRTLDQLRASRHHIEFFELYIGSDSPSYHFTDVRVKSAFFSGTAPDLLGYARLEFANMGFGAATLRQEPRRAASNAVVLALIATANAALARGWQVERPQRR